MTSSYSIFLAILFVFVAQSTSSVTQDTRASRSQRSPRIKINCYQTLCPDPNATLSVNGTRVNCSFLEDCQCELLDEKYRKSGSYACSIQCPQLPPLQFIYDGKSEVLSATCMENTEGFDLFFQQFRNLLYIVNPIGIKLVNCHRKEVSWDFEDGCKTSNESFIDRYNVSQTPPSDRIQALDLSDNCFTDFHGKFPFELELLEVLDMSTNLLTTIPDHAFNGLTYLGELHLAYNKIKTITQQSFRGLMLLLTLNLEGNRISSLSEDVFLHMKYIEVLNLRENQIQTLPGNIIGHMTPMKTIDFGKNKIETLPEPIFENLSYVTEILLDSNRLYHLPNFNGLMQLEILDLNDNELQALPNNIFETNIRLRELDISSNFLHDLSALVTPFLFMTKLEMLKIINNNITALTVPLTTLKSFAAHVDLSHNCISNYQETVLHIVSDFDSGKFTLTCTDCCIKKVAKELIAGVTTADFENNRIDTMDMKFFRLIAGMEQIDLSYNIIRDVDVSWEYPLVNHPDKNPSKTVVKLYHNPVVCECEILPFLELIGNISKPPYDKKRSKMIFDVYDMYCIEPPLLRGVQLDKVLNKEDELAKLVCNITGHCPRGCHCYDILGDDVKMLNCTSRGTTTFPRLGNYGHPIYLHLENNTISKLPAIETWTWSQMRELYLDNNNLTSLENMIVFPTLRTLSLRNNSLDHLPETMKSLFTAGTYSVSVLLSGNPWDCNCDLLEMRELMKIKGNVLDYNSVTCILPKSSEKVFLINATASQLCPQPVPEVNLVKIIVPTVASILVILCVCAAFGYRYKEDIKLWILRPAESSCLVMNSRGKL